MNLTLVHNPSWLNFTHIYHFPIPDDDNDKYMVSLYRYILLNLYLRETTFPGLLAQGKVAGLGPAWANAVFLLQFF